MQITNKVHPTHPVLLYIRDFSGTTCPGYDEDISKLWDITSRPSLACNNSWRVVARGNEDVVDAKARREAKEMLRWQKSQNVAYPRPTTPNKNNSSITHWLTSRRELRTREEPADSSATLDQREIEVARRPTEMHDSRSGEKLQYTWIHSANSLQNLLLSFIIIVSMIIFIQFSWINYTIEIKFVTD